MPKFCCYLLYLRQIVPLLCLYKVDACHDAIINSPFFSSFTEFYAQYKSNPRIISSFVYICYYFSHSGTLFCPFRSLDIGKYYLSFNHFIEQALGFVQSFPDDDMMCKHILDTIEAMLKDSRPLSRLQCRAELCRCDHEPYDQTVCYHSQRLSAKPNPRRAGPANLPSAQLDGTFESRSSLTTREHDDPPAE